MLCNCILSVDCCILINIALISTTAHPGYASDHTEETTGNLRDSVSGGFLRCHFALWQLLLLLNNTHLVNVNHTVNSMLH